MRRLTLYTTLGCHLCEQLEAELSRIGTDDITLQRVEIADSDALIADYGTRIPVLADEQGDELERGLEPDRLAAWLDIRGLLAFVEESPQVPEKPVGARQVNGRRFLG
nr:glutaredoxin family protein [uncultured Halomonas sp.]